MGNLLISGRGTDVGYGKDWAATIGIAVGIFILGVILASQVGMQRVFRVGIGHTYEPTEQFFLIVFGSIVLSIVIYIYFARYIKKHKKTEIHVFENGIMGVGIGKGIGDFQLQNFNSGFDRIASVDVSKTVVITINMYGRVCTVAAPNATKIAEIINFKLHEHAAMRNNQTN